MRQYIVEECGGQGYVFLCQHLGPRGVLEPIFNRARDEEYAEIIHGCEELFHELEEETASSHFTFAELEENEEDLAKLETCYEKAKKRDLLHASGSQGREDVGGLPREPGVVLESRLRCGQRANTPRPWRTGVFGTLSDDPGQGKSRWAGTSTFSAT